MKIALIGYGKMGRIIERIALERGHEIVCVIDIDNRDDFASEAYKSADVAIEFSVPAVAVSNIRSSFAAGVPVVCGTTGWTEALPDLQREIEEGGHTLFWSSNYSLGVNIFMKVNSYLAKLMNRFPEYNVEMTEVHHTQKLDAPSGTAITLAEGILNELDRKTAWSKETEASGAHLAIRSIREGQVPGIHTIRYESDVDSITMTHDAKSREGFALGAVVAAEFTAGKKGLLGMKDLFKFD
ncbi:MAG: 4-hydroxy-tetrahydrodipicolinate reductase [Bacteroidales bacterium]|jgi:4-hydroxy-tetrahydrodipicolinate reductase|nr:MAG: 4-hydroxy-tetrahydrodipicolinate reductase [Paludibacter sp.]MCE1155696.1 4-hydroxy-tetrahydrodipicolinate reductase [Bacteroidales bacterium]OJX87811.1 MAG: 4-hydroxy-tetrahydrodipicolinate reductase [Paludibacter sp. 47-17]